MKKIQILILAFCIMLAGCDKKELIPDGTFRSDGEKIEVTVHASGNVGKPATKTSVGGETGNTVMWAENDALGVFASDGNKNVSFTLNPLDIGKTSGSFFGALKPFNGTIYSYYPYNNNSSDANAVPVFIPVDGHEYDGSYDTLGNFTAFGNYSYMVSEPVKEQKLNAEASVAIAPILKYDHVMAVLNLKLTSKAAKSITVNSVELVCAGKPVFTTSGTLNITEENIDKRLTVNNPVKKESIKVNLPASDNKLVIAPNGTRIVRMMIFPANTEGETITFKVNVTVDGSKAPVDLFATKPGKNLLRGMMYDVPFSITVVESADQAQEALDNGAESVVITNEIGNGVTLTVPVIEQSSQSLSLAAPIQNGSTVTLKESATTSPEPAKVSLTNTSSATEVSQSGSVILEMPNSTVNVSGTFNTITATTAENTLIIEKDAVVEELVVKKGNVIVYGTVHNTINQGKGQIFTYAKSAEEFKKQLSDNNEKEKGGATILLMGGVTYDLPSEPVVISKPVSIESDNSTNPAIIKFNSNSSENSGGFDIASTAENVKFKNLDISSSSIVGKGVINANGVNLTVEGCKITQNTPGKEDGSAKMTMGINLATVGNNRLLLDNTRINLTKEKQIGINAYASIPANSGEYNTIVMKDSEITTGNAETPKTYSRGINIGNMQFPDNNELKVLSMENSTIEGVYYAVNVTGSDDLLKNAIVEVKHSTLDGRCGFNVWKNNVKFNVNNSTIIGRNMYTGKSETFGGIVLNEYVAGTEWTINNSTIISKRSPQTTFNPQYALDIRYQGNTVTFGGSNSFVDESNSLNYFISGVQGNTITGAEGITLITERPGASVVLSESKWDGKMVAPVISTSNIDIYTAAELAWLADQVNYRKNTFAGKTVILRNDINLNDYPWIPIGAAGTHSFTTTGTPENLFKGIFDGKNHTISNLNVEIETDAKGLFGAVEGGSLKNIKIKGANVPSTAKAGKWIGGLVGYFKADNDTNQIVNCSVENITVQAPGMYRIGGLVGHWTGVKSKIINCSVTQANLTGGYGIGGLVGSVLKAGLEIESSRVDDIHIYHKDQYCWQWDKTYPNYAKETAGFVYASSPLAGDVTNLWIDEPTSKQIGENWTITDQDGNGRYEKVKWSKLPYAGEIGNLYINETLQSKDSKPEHNNKFNPGEPGVWSGKTVKPVAEDGTYKIYSAAEFAGMAKLVNDNRYNNSVTLYKDTVVTLMVNIDLNNLPWTPIGWLEWTNNSNTSSPQRGFYGKFEGDGKKISNVLIEMDANCKGVFGKLENGASINKLNVEKVAIRSVDSKNFSNGKWVGGLVGYLSGGASLTDCNITNVEINKGATTLPIELTSSAARVFRLGGLVGFWATGGTGTFKNCSATKIHLVGSDCMAGLLGSIQGDNKKIESCSVSDIEIHHKNQWIWSKDYIATGGRVFASSALIGDQNKVTSLDLNDINVGVYKIYDDDNSNLYDNISWSKLPYVGEVNTNFSLNGQSQTADEKPAQPLVK